jgi:uncharacterized protein (DUF3820 family)
MGLSNRTKLSDDDKMPFGKHKGKRLGDVPDDYWMWFLRQDWCDEWPYLVEYANLIGEG